MSDKPNNIPSLADFFSWLSQMMTAPVNAATQAAQNNPQMADPLAMWRKFNEKNEEALAQYMQQMVGTPEFAQLLGRTTNNAANYKQMVKQTAKAYLEAAEMPSREDLARLAEQIVMLDAKVDDLNDNLSDNLDSVPQLLNRVVSLLETMTNRVAQLEAQIQKLSQQGPSAVTERLTALEIQLKQMESKLNSTPAQASIPSNAAEVVEAALAPAKSSRARKAKTSPKAEPKQGEEVH